MARPRSRVGFVVHTFDMGGLERYICHLLNHLDRSRFEPSLVCLGRNGTASSWLSVTDVPILELGKAPGNPGPRFLRQVRDTFRSSRLELVHSHNWGTLVETAVAASLAGRLVHVHSERGTVLGGSKACSLWRRKINSWVLWATLSHCDAVLAVDKSVAARVEAHCGFRHDRIEVIPNGVPRPACADPTEARARIRQTLGIQPHEPLLCALGRLVPVKGYDLLISAVAEARKRIPQLHLVFVGGGELQETLRSQTRLEGLESAVHFAGRQTQIGDWLAASDVFVNSSRSEGMSQAIVEAMTFGLPLVVTDVGGNASLAGGGDPCGLIVPAEDSAALAGAIVRMVLDNDLAKACSRAAEERARSCFSLPAMVRRYEDLYSKLLERRPRRRTVQFENAATALAETDTREE